MTVPDLLRLLAVPVFAWAAWHDVQTRRIQGWIWYPLVALGVVLIGWDWLILPMDPFTRQLFLIRVVLSIVLLGGLGFAFYYFGALGMADAKAFLTISIVFPIYPIYKVGVETFPLFRSTHGIFSLSIIVDGAIVGIAVPLGLFAWNVANGRFSPKGFFYLPTPVDSLLTSIGSMYVGEPPQGSVLARFKYYISMLDPQKDRLDLDALRMYLRWRGISLSDLRAYPDQLRRPSTLPVEPQPPTDGVVNPELDPDPVGGIPPATFGGVNDDTWGAETFLDDVGSAYGTTSEQLRTGLDLICSGESVWVTPGLPMLVSFFVGLLVALVFGDILYVVLRLIGLA